MALLAGINHIAFISADIDRLKDFYARVFNAECILDEIVTHGDESARHAFINRGRIDHIALQASSEEAFEEVRLRLVAEGSTDGAVTDFGEILSVFFRDPEGMEAEVAYWKDGDAVLMRTGKVDCDIRKWNGKPHYRFETEHLGQDVHGRWLAARPPLPFEGPDYPGVFEQAFVLLVPDDRWWAATFYVDGTHTDIEIYVDVTTPSKWTSDSHVTTVDLDLDVVLRRDGTLYIDDEDEFEEHRVLYGYPEDVIETARRTATEMLDTVAQRVEPFGDVWRRWLDKV